MRQRIIDILGMMKADTFERDEALALSLLSALAGENIFLLGLPGVGKSMIARRLKLAFKDAKVFEYLMSRFSTPDEIFGPVSISKLKDEDCYERIVDGYLPDAEVVFLDEIWKAGPAIQNSLLTVLNEKIYLNGNNELKLPLKGVIAASNELPAKDEGLEALWDRFLVRYIVNPITSKENFFRLICPEGKHSGLSPIEQFTNAEYWAIQTDSRKTALPEMILETIYKIREKLNDKVHGKNKSGDVPVENQKYYVSDRRWKKAVGILQTSAYLNGRDEVDLSDVLLLCHILWNEDSMISEIRQIVAETIVSTLFGDLLEKYKSYKRHAVVKPIAKSQFYSPDNKHYILQCDDIPLKLSISDYEEMRDNPNDMYFGSEAADNTIIVRPRGQFVMKFAKEGAICINSYTYPLRTVADNQLSEDFLADMGESIDSMGRRMFDMINQNLFVRSSELPSIFHELIRLYKQRFETL